MYQYTCPHKLKFRITRQPYTIVQLVIVMHTSQYSFYL
uniref:Uncharacterized protein n=1 Tax=Arundo donax TaxID=35708 RepID=A0A0A9BJE8_ARUDO